MSLKLSAFALFAAATNIVCANDTEGGLTDPFARVSSCVGEKNVSLESSCLVSTFLSLAIDDEGFDPAICSPPSIEKSITIFGDASKACVNVGNGESSLDGITPFDAVALFDGCWKDFCEDFTGTVKETVDNGIKQVKDSFLEMASQCNGGEINLDTCVASTALDILVEGIIESIGGMGSGNRFLEENNMLMDEICNLPEIDDDAVSYITDQAVAICVGSGHEESQEHALQVKNTIKSLFREDSCLATFCKDTLETAIEAIDEGKSAVQGFITDTLNQCNVDGEVAIPHDSCVISTSVEWIFQSVLGSMDNYYQTDNGDGRSLSYYDNLIANEVCGAVLSMIEPSIFMDIVKLAGDFCHDEGNPAPEIADVTKAIEMYFGTCLPSQCIASVQGGLSAVKNMAVEEVSECTGVPLSLDSCVVSSSMDLFIMGALSSFGEPQSDPSQPSLPYQRRMMDNFEENGVLNSAEICGLAPMNGESILAIVNGGKTMCLEKDQNVSDYDDVLTAINSLFSDGSCVATFCKEVVEDVMKDVEDVITAVNLEQTALEYVFNCADIQVDSLSCVETAFMEEALTHYLNADGESAVQPEHEARRVRERKTRKTRRRLSVSTKSPGYNHTSTSTKAPSKYHSTKSPNGYHSTKSPSSYHSTKSPSGYHSTKVPSGHYSTKSPHRSTKSPGPLPESCPIQKPSEAELINISQKAVNRCNAEGAITIAPGEMVRLDSFVQKLLHAECFDNMCSDDVFIFILSKSIEKIGDICDNVSARSNQGQMFMKSLCPLPKKNSEPLEKTSETQAPSSTPLSETQAPSEKEEEKTSGSSDPKQRFVPFLAMLAALYIA